MFDSDKQPKTEPQRNGQGGTPDTASTIERLARRLSSGAGAGAADGLAADLQQLREQIASLETHFTRQLAAASARADAAEAKLADQRERLNALGRGREESMVALSETRAELARVARQRDELERQIASLESMQTATMTLSDDDAEESPAVIHALPSVDDLMASLHSLSAAERDAPPRLHAQEDGDNDMIDPELVFPEGVDDEPDEQPPRTGGRTISSKVLVFVDADPPIKYPLFKEVTTLGRSEDADIRVDGDYISRVHARIVLTGSGAVVEDLASKNGIKVNFKPADRRKLRHGDILSLGKLHFTFIDTDAGAAAE